MIKCTKFQDIQQLTRAGSWECDFDFLRLLPYLREEQTRGLNLDPDFQRTHVWTEQQQTAFLEFILRGGKTGRVLYFNMPSWHSKLNIIDDYNDYVVVDGKQRIEAVRRFVDNEIKVFGSYLSEYTDEPRVMTTRFKININDLNTRAAVLQWYLEFNSGGTPHTAKELNKVRKLLVAESCR